jgi:hypothetical protein
LFDSELSLPSPKLARPETVRILAYPKNTPFFHFSNFTAPGYIVPEFVSVFSVGKA